jgi:hypothetical protein
MGNYSPNDMGGQSFQGYMGNPTAPNGNYNNGNYNPSVSSSYSFPEYPNSGNFNGGYDTWNDPYLNPTIGGFYGGGWDNGGENYSPWNGNFGGWAGGGQDNDYYGNPVPNDPNLGGGWG